VSDLNHDDPARNLRTRSCRSRELDGYVIAERSTSLGCSRGPGLYVLDVRPGRVGGDGAGGSAQATADIAQAEASPAESETGRRSPRSAVSGGSPRLSRTRQCVCRSRQPASGRRRPQGDGWANRANAPHRGVESGLRNDSRRRSAGGSATACLQVWRLWPKDGSVQPLTTIVPTRSGLGAVRFQVSEASCRCSKARAQGVDPLRQTDPQRWQRSIRTEAYREHA